jgi:hypothetical protein
MYKRITLNLVRQHPSGLLLGAQVLQVLLHPFLEQSTASRAGFVVFGNVVLALALWVVFRSPLMNWIGLVLALPAMALSLAGLLGGQNGLLAIAHVFEAAVYLYAAIGLIAYMLNDTEVTTDELLAIGATFTLLAWAFAYAFSACQHFVPGSFAIGPDATRPMSWFELLFLSFTVISSVGLSDILPVTSFARSLVMIEMFCGVMYMAIIVSRLIGMLSLRHHQNR